MPIQYLLIGVYYHLILRTLKLIHVHSFYQLICETLIGSISSYELGIFFEDILEIILQMGIISEDTFTF